MNPTSKAAVLGQAGLTAMAARVSAANLRGFGADGGFGQPANNAAASKYKTNCVSCHGQDGRGSAVGRSLPVADFHSAQFNSSLARSWLTSSLKREELCLLSGLG